jgi:hypothetical protein
MAYASLGGVLSRRFPTALLTSCFVVACGSADRTSSSNAGLNRGACASGEALAGTSYDLSLSRFAFGSKPDPIDAGSLTRWTGSDGVVALFSDGSEIAELNASAPEATRASLSPDGTS